MIYLAWISTIIIGTLFLILIASIVGGLLKERSEHDFPFTDDADDRHRTADVFERRA